MIDGLTQEQAAPKARILSRFRGEILLGWIVVLTLVILIGAPLLSVLLQAFLPGLFFGDSTVIGPGTLLQVFQRPLWRVSLRNSLVLATGAMLVGGGLGTMLAILRHSYAFRCAQALDTTAWVLLIMPSFVIAQGWILFASRGGIANQWLGLDFIGQMIFTPWGLIAIMALKNYPFAYLTVAAAMRWDVANYTNAARLCGANPWRVMTSIRVPLLLPAVLSGMMLVFVDTVGDFGLPAALATSYRYPTLTYSIYVAISQSPIRFDLAGVLSIYLVGITAVAIGIHMAVIRSSFYDFLTASAKDRELVRPVFAPLLTGIALAFVMISLVLPIGTSALVSVLESISAGPIWGNFTLRHYDAFFEPGSPFLASLRNSLAIASIAGVTALVIGVAGSYMATFVRFWLNGLIDIISTVTLAVPGVILGVGYIFVWNQPWLDRLDLRIYGSPIILVLAATAGAIPLAMRTTLGSFAQIPASFLAAASMQGAPLFRRLRTIVLPLAFTALLSALLASFGTTVFDLAVSSILRPPSFQVLPVTINRQFQMGNFGLSTAATFVGTVITVGIILFLDLGLRRLMVNQIKTTGDDGESKRSSDAN
ncbi:MAG: ABC transporter permease [Cyanophyceae cyanobacterium]|jgi:iron(III) transport system permease protein